MSKTIKLKKGLDIRLVGAAERIRSGFIMPDLVALKPTDFHGMTPKMVVKEGDPVKAGETIFYDKYNDSIKYASPVSGILKAIVRGEKRRIMEVQITPSEQIEYAVSDENLSLTNLSSEDVKRIMLTNGLWPFIKQRPLDVVANPNTSPKAIFVSGFDSSPLAPDFDFVMKDGLEDFQSGITALSKLTSGKVHLTLDGKSPNSIFKSVKDVQINSISGKHPAGNVGTQIHHIDPINKGEFVWTLSAQDVALIGRFFATGRFDLRKTIAITGSEIKKPAYIETIVGASVSSLLKEGISSENVRIISGNPLTGDNVGEDGYLGFYHNQITVLPEGNKMKFAPTDGWAVPLGFKKFSNTRLFASKLLPNKEFKLDTNTNGEERAFVVTGELEKVFPFDILPMQLTKAAITGDIDGMENLGIYEVIAEDFALCEFVCSSKINIQDEIQQGLDLIAKECM